MINFWTVESNALKFDIQIYINNLHMLAKFQFSI